MSTTGNRMRRRGLVGPDLRRDRSDGASRCRTAGVRRLRRNVVAAAARAATIKIDNFAFTPPDLTIAAGTTVTWKNDDDSPHRVTDEQ